MSAAPVTIPDGTIVTVTMSASEALRAGQQMRSMAHGGLCGPADAGDLFARVGGQLFAAALAEVPSAAVHAPAQIAARGPRVVITGGPRTGKSTLARKLLAQLLPEHPSVVLYHTDDLMDLDDWSAVSQHVVDHWFPRPGPWILEGVRGSHALRKRRDQHPGERPPVDRVIYLTEPHAALLPGQLGMAKSVATVHRQVEQWLTQHGVATERMSTVGAAVTPGLAHPARNIEVR